MDTVKVKALPLAPYYRSNVERRRRPWHTVRSARLIAPNRMSAMLATHRVISSKVAHSRIAQLVEQLICNQ